MLALLASAALAGDTGERVKDGVVVGLGALGAGVAGGLAVGVPAGSMVRSRCDPDPMVSHGSCQPFLWGAIGFTVGAASGSVLGGALVAPAVRRRGRTVLAGSLVPVAVGGLLIAGAFGSADAGLGAAGAVTVVLGTPIAAGIAAGLAPERDLPLWLAVEPRGIHLVARW